MSVALVLSLLGSQTIASTACHLPVPNPALPNLSPDELGWSSGMLPRGWKFGIGPTMFDIVANYTGVGDAILGAAAQWNNVVPARGFGWDGLMAPTSSDCSSGKPSGKPFQLGALNFSTNTNCASLNALKATDQYQDALIIAYADFNTHPGCVYPQCGTKSVTINLARAWTTSQTPLPAVYDLQSALVHEFGHTLGLAHMGLGYLCESTVSADCNGVDPVDVHSMQNEVKAGQICGRTITGNTSNSTGDYSSMKQRYPND